MEPSTTTSPYHQKTSSKLSEGGWTEDRGCLKHCVDGSAGFQAFRKRKNSYISALEVDEDLIAKALAQMPIGERNRLYESIHGVEEIKEEDDPQHIQALQDKMRQEIYGLVAEVEGAPHLNGLNVALQLNEEYVLQPKQLLRFLRSDLYDPVKAARRLSRFFDWKLELWGADKLTRDIVLDDLSKDELDFYKLGYGQRLPSRDQGGREVLVHFQMNQKNPEDTQSLARLLFYNAMPDEGSEKLGIVLISFFLEGFRWDRLNPRELQIYSRVINDMPVKIASIHQCYMDKKSPGLANTVKNMLTLMDEDIRGRMKIHQGSYTEICCALMTFGIPHGTIPLTHDGKLKTKIHQQFLQMRKTMENYREAGHSVAMIGLPLNSDILLGRGLPFQSHQGNMQLQAIVDEYVDKYCAMTNSNDKTQLAAAIVLMVKQKGGRFLSKESGVWIEVDDRMARKKVTQIFQYRKKHAKNTVSSYATANESAASMRHLCPLPASERSLKDRLGYFID